MKGHERYGHPLSLLEVVTVLHGGPVQSNALVDLFLELLFETRQSLELENREFMIFGIE
jgi:hypothetical protein